MNLKVITVYCLCDDILTALHIHNDVQCRMTCAEVMTVGIVAALFYSGNVQLSRRFLSLCGYIPKMLSHSRLHRRLLSIPNDIWEAVFIILKNLLNQILPTKEFAIDSCPLLACQPCRSWRCKLYQGKQYLGYCASKKLHYYGLKLHLIVSEHGVLIEFFLTPASCADISGLKQMQIDLPEDSVLFGDRAYNSFSYESELKEDACISLISQRKIKSKRQHSGAVQFIQKFRRKVVETVFSQIIRLMPRSIKVRSSKGFELRIFLFLLAYSIDRFSPSLAP